MSFASFPVSEVGHKHTHKQFMKGVCPHPVGISFQRSDHGNEEWLLQQSDHSADHGLEACQCAKVIGRVAAGEKRVGYGPFKSTQRKDADQK